AGNSDEKTKEIFEKARKVASDANAPMQERISALRILGRGFDKRQEDMALLSSLLVPQNPVELQSAAINTLAKLRAEDLPANLLGRWKGFSLALRTQVADVLISRNE